MPGISTRNIPTWKYEYVITTEIQMRLVTCAHYYKQYKTIRNQFCVKWKKTYLIN